MKDPQQPECRTETIDGRPAYMCEHEVDGEKRKFGVTFRTDGVACGEHHNGHLEGHGARLYFEDEDPAQLICSHFVDDKANGSVSWYFFKTKNIEFGRKTVIKMFECTLNHQFSFFEY